MAFGASFLRRAAKVEAFIVFWATLTLALASAYAVQLSRAPDNGVFGHGLRWSTAWAVFFYGTTPVVTIFAATASMVLYKLKKVTPLYGLVMSTILFIGWATTVSLWTNCHMMDLTFDGSSDYCYQNSLTSSGDGLEGVNEDLAKSMLAVAFLMMFTYFFYMIYAAVSFHNLRKAKHEPPAEYDMPVRRPAAPSTPEAGP